MFSLPGGREWSCRPSHCGRRLPFIVVGHFSRLETSFWFLEPLAARLVSGPLNILRLAWFLTHTLLPLPRGTFWSERPLLWLHTTFDARRLVFGAIGRVFRLPICCLASALVCFWYEPSLFGRWYKGGRPVFLLGHHFSFFQQVFLSNNWLSWSLDHLF